MLVNQALKCTLLNDAIQGSEIATLIGILCSFQTLNGDNAGWSVLKWMMLIMLMDIFYRLKLKNLNNDNNNNRALF